MQLTRFEVLALLPDEPEVKGYQIIVSPSGRTVLEEWTQDYETVVDGLPENIHARLAWHKSRTELGILIFVKIGANPKTQVSFYLKPDPTKVRKRYRINPDRPKQSKPAKDSGDSAAKS
ncbi:MAG TPA: hypothetical protein PLD20_09265 [Blastocatellia bacterium]|nr:hypothetical protein [Blastocatellia bacterium]HMX25983.1 hypothetical protein [Blastocatellia bacterium]HMY74843.1 hypothetical protein [Blastocatellia bacterium]HMZ18107.1 hypothetical protein [Blastocatellia bacterium]HNG31266.1 hypothetical protein [Blastocatellia bacterium]